MIDIISKNILILFVIVVSLSKTFSQSAHKLLREGDASYLDEDYSIAEENYRKSLEKKNTTKGNFNLGNSVYQQQRYEEAIQQYEHTFQQATTDAEKANALYNLGNAQLKSGQIEPSIESYKSAARLNPNDDDILRNLYMAKLMMKQQQEQQQQQQEQQNQDNQEDQSQNQEQQQQQNQEQQEQQSKDSDINNEGEQEKQAPQEQELSKDDALKLLEVIENEEKNVQEKLRKVSGDKKKPKKDW